MPRKSAAEIATLINVTGKSARLTAPASMSAGEKVLFNELIGACAPEHFRRSDIPLIRSYVEATLVARSAAKDPQQVKAWAQAIKLQCTLSTRLRLAPSARSDPKTVGRATQPLLRFPWETSEQFQDRLRGDEQAADSPAFSK